MIKRKIQKITSPYDLERVRRGKIEEHPALDLRVYNFTNWVKQPVIFPCDCLVTRIGFQEKWGWYLVARPYYDGEIEEIKFMHLKDPDILEGASYNKGVLLGWTGRTEYMIRNKMGEHLHFETWLELTHRDPTIFYDEIGVKYA